MNYKKHTLANGSTIVTMSPHGFKFNDGTESSPQDRELCDLFTLRKDFVVAREIKGMKLTKTIFKLSNEQLDLLRSISTSCDLVVVPFQLLEAISRSTNEFKNIVAFNSTPETARSAPQDKIVDVNNWSVID